MWSSCRIKGCCLFLLLLLLIFQLWWCHFAKIVASEANTTHSSIACQVEPQLLKHSKCVVPWFTCHSACTIMIWRETIADVEWRTVLNRQIWIRTISAKIWLNYQCQLFFTNHLSIGVAKSISRCWRNLRSLLVTQTRKSFSHRRMSFNPAPKLSKLRLRWFKYPVVVTGISWRRDICSNAARFSWLFQPARKQLTKIASDELKEI